MEPERDDHATRFTLFILCTITLANLVDHFLPIFFVICYDIYVQLSEAKENLKALTGFHKTILDLS